MGRMNIKWVSREEKTSLSNTSEGLKSRISSWEQKEILYKGGDMWLNAPSIWQPHEDTQDQDGEEGSPGQSQPGSWTQTP